MKRCLVALALAACSDGSHPLTDGGPLQFTGEFVDMESGNALFCGIFGAQFTVHGDSTRTDSTNPNGRFMLSLVPALRTQVDITPPTAQSECSQPKSSYSHPGIIIADANVINAGAMYSARMYTDADSAQFSPDPAKAQVLVHVEGTRRAVSITGTHAATMAFDGTSWAAGDTGINVLFPNVDVGGGTTNITMAGSTIGAGSAPLAANTFTFVTLVGK